MFRAATWLIVTAAFIYGGMFVWQHRGLADPVVQAEPAPDVASPEARQAQQLVTVTGPLADYMHDAPAKTQAPHSDYKSSVEDHIEASPVGTNMHIVQKNFPLTRAVQFAFQIPPHAATPRLHGTFSSFVQQGLGPSAEESAANINILLLNEEQFSAFASGREPDVLLVTEASHAQDVNFELAPSQTQPVRYHLVFRSTPGSAPKKVVHADFTVEF